MSDLFSHLDRCGSQVALLRLLQAGAVQEGRQVQVLPRSRGGEEVGQEGPVHGQQGGEGGGGHGGLGRGPAQRRHPEEARGGEAEPDRHREEEETLVALLFSLDT